MARGIYSHELVDSEIAWLLQTFKEKRSDFIFLEPEELPTCMVRITTGEYHKAMIELEKINAAAAETESDVEAKPADKNSKL